MTPARADRIDDPVRFAEDLAAFLRALWSVDADEGPLPGRTASSAAARPRTTTTRPAPRSRALDGRVDARPGHGGLGRRARRDVDRAPVWFHGDIADGNLLVRDGVLSAVIDFGTSGVGDPACDLVVAWTFFSGEGRAASATPSTRTRAPGRGPAGGRCGRR